MKKRIIFGALALLVYPFVALASLMGLAGHTTGNEPALFMILARAFYIGTLCYPLVFIGCVITALVMRKQDKEELLVERVAAGPLFFLAVLGALFCVLAVLGILLGHS